MNWSTEERIYKAIRILALKWIFFRHIKYTRFSNGRILCQGLLNFLLWLVTEWYTSVFTVLLSTDAINERCNTIKLDMKKFEFSSWLWLALKIATAFDIQKKLKLTELVSVCKECLNFFSEYFFTLIHAVPSLVLYVQVLAYSKSKKQIY